MLSRKLGHKNHYPAIDVLQSISRCMSQIVTKEHKMCIRDRAFIAVVSILSVVLTRPKYQVLDVYKRQSWNLRER